MRSWCFFMFMIHWFNMVNSCNLCDWFSKFNRYKLNLLDGFNRLNNNKWLFKICLLVRLLKQSVLAVILKALHHQHSVWFCVNSCLCRWYWLVNWFCCKVSCWYNIYNINSFRTATVWLNLLICLVFNRFHFLKGSEHTESRIDVNIKCSSIYKVWFFWKII